MAVRAAVLLIAVGVCATMCSACDPKGVMITFPLSVHNNSTNRILINTCGLEGSGYCVFALEYTDTAKNNTKKVIARKDVDIEEGEYEKTVDWELKDISDYQYYQLVIWANCTFEDDDYEFSEQDTVNVEQELPSLICFIQTDKPIYQVGQKVYARILLVDFNLRPVGETTLADVYIENPKGSRMAQWKRVDLGKGMKQFEFLLSDKPPLGDWRIIAELPNLKRIVIFKVLQYLLPKYEVKITPERYVLIDKEITPIEICARYTYGRDVAGTIKINSTLEPYYWSPEKLPSVVYETKIKGCYTYNLNISKVDPQKQTYRRILVSVQFTEDGTGVSRNATAYIERTSNPFTIEFLGPNNNQGFKPGMPLRRKIRATAPDMSPAAGELIQVCAKLVRQKDCPVYQLKRVVSYCKNFTLDSNGETPFCVFPTRNDTISLNLQATAMNYGYTPSAIGGLYRRRPIIIHPPQGSLRLQPYYSPSRNYIQVENDGGILPCGAVKFVEVLYTAKKGETYNFYYQVISKGEVRQQGIETVTYTGEGDRASPKCRKAIAVDDVRTTLIPEKVQKGVPYSTDVSCSRVALGVLVLGIDVTADMSPSFCLIVHYVRPDREVIADSSKFQVEKCFQNKVEFSFKDKEVQPGANTSYTLTASPNSICGIKVIDKSVSLLDSSETFNKEKVFEELKRYEPSDYYYRDHCNEKFQRGERKKRVPTDQTYRYSSSKYIDSLTPFENCGRIVLSSYRVLTRPCSSGQGVTEDVEQLPRSSRASGVLHKGKRMSARGRAVLFDAEDSAAGRAAPASTATVSVVETRQDFKETWLFEIVMNGDDGEVQSERQIPDTITQWVGSAVCINEEDGLGISEPTNITTFQAFFVDITHPASVIRGEKVEIIVTAFNYLEKSLPITVVISVEMLNREGTVVSTDSQDKSFCVRGGNTESYKFDYTPEKVGSLNITVTGETATDPSVCDNEDTADVYARDQIRKSIPVEPEGYPQRQVKNHYVCLPEDSNEAYQKSYDIEKPEDSVEDSHTAYTVFTGDLIRVGDLKNLVQLPSGCGEQNIAKLAPIVVVLEYANETGQLTEELKEKCIRDLYAGYQNQENFVHPDGSYSAFGTSDSEGSMMLTALVLQTYAKAAKYMYIDPDKINQIRNWILQKQDSNGCFPPIGRVFTEYMKGGVGSDGKENYGPMTAYVSIALLDSGYRNETVTSKAFECIRKDENLTEFKAALYAYCAALAENWEYYEEYIEYLNQRKLTGDDGDYWRNINGSQPQNIVTSGYAILAICQRNPDDLKDKVLPIGQNMTVYMNANGGFQTSQDTVVGLAGLACCAKIISRNPLDMSITITISGQEQKSFTINSDNRLLEQKTEVPVPSRVDLDARGTGCVLIQVVLYYYTYTVPQQRDFTLTITVTQSEDCRTATLHLCLSYLPPDRKSNMAVLRVKLVSGYEADREQLEQLPSQNRLIRKTEVENNVVIVYWEELSNEVVCFDLVTSQYASVLDQKDAYADVTDYYDPVKKQSIIYGVPECSQ